jgi:hypothetical protein
MGGEQDFEKEYWGTCVNTFDEDQKHYEYAKLMGLHRTHYSFDVGNRRILDIGGGPSSMLLKCVNLKEGKICDPLEFPSWVYERYKLHNITVETKEAEELTEDGWDEAWIYNCLQHTTDPEKIVHNALRSAPVFRIFEWVDQPPHPGHPHELTEASLNEWIGKPGNVIDLSSNGCFGRAYYNIKST